MKKPLIILVILFASLFLFSAKVFATEWYVSPSGTAGGNGLTNSPWDLQTALNHPASVQPGDTIWLRGGTYSGTFISILSGTSESPIIVRQYPGERATLDGGNSSDATLTTHNSNYSSFSTYTHFWGFEIKHTSTDRISSETGSTPSDICTGDGIDNNEGKVGNKFINLIIHDNCGNGVATNSGAEDTEYYGNIVYYNGWDASDRGHGHGFYFQSQTSTKTIKDNILFKGHSIGIKLYGINGYINNFYVEGNTSFNNGTLSDTTGYAWNILLGGENQIANNSTVTSNYTYFDPAKSGGRNEVGYVAGCDDATVTDNYFSKSNAVTGGSIFSFGLNCTNVIMTGNTFIGPITGFSSINYPNNSYYSSPPPVTKIFVRNNTYESERANITIYNWKSFDSIAVDVSNILSNNQEYNIYDVENYFGDPIVTGTYTGEFINIPMTSSAVSTPLLIASPTHTSKEFGSFILVGGAQASPTPTPSLVLATTTDTNTDSPSTTTSNSDSSVTTDTGVSTSVINPTVKLTQTTNGRTSISSKGNLANGLEFSGEAPASSLIKITLANENGKKIPDSTKVSKDRTWSWKPPSNLQPGDYSATFLVQDKKGNTGNTTLKFTIEEDGTANTTESIQESSGEFVIEEQTLFDDLVNLLKNIFVNPIVGLLN